MDYERQNACVRFCFRCLSVEFLINIICMCCVNSKQQHMADSDRKTYKSLFRPMSNGQAEYSLSSSHICTWFDSIIARCLHVCCLQMSGGRRAEGMASCWFGVCGFSGVEMMDAGTLCLLCLCIAGMHLG